MIVSKGQHWKKKKKKPGTFGVYNQIEEIKGTFAPTWYKGKKRVGSTVSTQTHFIPNIVKEGQAINKKRRVKGMGMY